MRFSDSVFQMVKTKQLRNAQEDCVCFGYDLVYVTAVLKTFTYCTKVGLWQQTY